MTPSLFACPTSGRCTKSTSLGFGRRVPRHIQVQRSRSPSTFLSLFSGNFALDNTFLFIDLSVYGTIHIALPLVSSLQHNRASRDPILSTTYIPDRQADPQRWVVRRAPHPAPKEARTDKVATAIDRISAVAGQLSSPKQGKARLLEKNPDDVSPATFRLHPSRRGGCHYTC